MKKRLQEKILEEIRKKVIEKDLKRQTENEIKEMREANIEALTELTSLSRKEVEHIAGDVKTEFLKRQKQRRKKTITWSIIGGIVAIIVFLIVRPKPEPKATIVEDNFAQNQYEWDILNSFKYKRYFENGNYYMETNKTDWCYWDKMVLDLPKNYDVEIKTQWITGKYDEYGIGLNHSNKDYYAFMLRGDGASSFGKVVEKKWVIDDSWKDSVGNGGKNQSNLQRVEVRGKNFKYYVNDVLARNGTIDFKINQVAMRCCDKQAVAFDYIKVTNADNQEVVFEDDFTTPAENWNPKKDFTSESLFKDGKYIITGNSGDCYYSESVLHSIPDNCEIELTSTWLSGEMAGYGIMIMNNEDNYYSLELQNNGEARLVQSKLGEYSYVQNYQFIGKESDGKTPVVQKVVIKDGELTYFANDKFINKIETDLYLPCDIALRVCGKQSVAFEKLVIKAYEK